MRVLIVEDCAWLVPVLKGFVEVIFEQAGHEAVVVVVAADGQAALNELRQHRFSHVLCDLEFPQGNAIAVREAWLASHDEGDAAGQLFVANTGNLGHPDVASLRQLGVPVLKKPYEMSVLAKAFGLS